MRLIRDNSAQVAAWVSAKIPHVAGRPFGLCSAIGVADDAEFLFGIVFHDWQPQHQTMQFSMASASPKWARRGVILDLLAYPFEQAGVEKLWAAMPLSSERAIKLSARLGFVREAVLARHFGKEHAVIVRMFRRDYATLKERWNGQKLSRTAA